MREFRRLIRVAWREFQVTRQCATGAGEAYVAQWAIPRWFVAGELGFKDGPSIIYNLTHLEEANAERLDFLQRQADAPPSLPPSLLSAIRGGKGRKRRLAGDEAARLLFGAKPETEPREEVTWHPGHMAPGCRRIDPKPAHE